MLNKNKIVAVWQIGYIWHILYHVYILFGSDTMLCSIIIGSQVRRMYTKNVWLTHHTHRSATARKLTGSTYQLDVH